MGKQLEYVVDKHMFPKCPKKECPFKSKKDFECYGFGAYKSENGLIEVCDIYHNWLNGLKE